MDNNNITIGAKEYMQYFQEQEKFPKKTTKDIWEPFDKVCVMLYHN